MNITSNPSNTRPFSPLDPCAPLSGRSTPLIFSPTLDEELHLLQQQLEERSAKLREKESEIKHYQQLLEYLKNQLCTINRAGSPLASICSVEMEKKTSMKKSVSFVNETQVRFF